MKAVDLNKDEFWYENGVVSRLDMSSGKHIRFTAVDRSYDLTVEKPDKKNSKFSVPNDGTYHTYEIEGKNGDTYTFKMENLPPVTVPQMIVRVN